MKIKNKKIGSRILICIIVVAIFAAWMFFISANTRRITSQNERYIADATMLSASHVNNRFESKLNNIQMIAALYGDSMNSPKVDTDAILRLCPPGYFDYIQFLPADGQMTTSSGTTIDVTDREAYIKPLKITNRSPSTTGIISVLKMPISPLWITMTGFWYKVCRPRSLPVCAMRRTMQVRSWSAVSCWRFSSISFFWSSKRDSANAA